MGLCLYVIIDKLIDQAESGRLNKQKNGRPKKQKTGRPKITIRLKIYMSPHYIQGWWNRRLINLSLCLHFEENSCDIILTGLAVVRVTYFIHYIIFCLVTMLYSIKKQYKLTYIQNIDFILTGQIISTITDKIQ